MTLSLNADCFGEKIVEMDEFVPLLHEMMYKFEVLTKLFDKFLKSRKNEFPRFYFIA